MTKQAELEHAQAQAIANPGQSFTVTYKGGRVTYWFDGKLQYQKEA